jgi:hypothetical protein
MKRPIVSFFDHSPEFAGQPIRIRGIDGYFSGTDMSRAMAAFDGTSRRFNDWTRTQFARRLLSRISERSKIPIDYADLRSQSQTPLIDYVRGGTSGVWLHPYVAMSYAMSIPEFQAEVNIWIIDLLTLGTVNPHVLQWTREEYLRGMGFNRDDISDMYGRSDD